jgi:hypothetical protein
LLNGAERMLRGSRLYADFFEFLPPGGFLLTEAWFSIAGISVASARALAILTIVGIACFTYLACCQACKHAPLSALLATGWVVMSQGIWTQVSHHWFTTLFSMVAAWAALVSVEPAQRYLRWPLTAGAAAGMAAMVTPHRGALVMLAAVPAFLNLRRHRAELITYMLGCALVPIGLLAYVVWHDALAAAFDDVILFTAVRYAPIQSVPALGSSALGPSNTFSRWRPCWRSSSTLATGAPVSATMCSGGASRWVSPASWGAFRAPISPISPLQRLWLAPCLHTA